MSKPNPEKKFELWKKNPKCFRCQKVTRIYHVEELPEGSIHPNDMATIYRPAPGQSFLMCLGCSKDQKNTAAWHERDATIGSAIRGIGYGRYVVEKKLESSDVDNNDWKKWSWGESGFKPALRVEASMCAETPGRFQEFVQPITIVPIKKVVTLAEPAEWKFSNYFGRFKVKIELTKLDDEEI